MGIFFCFVMEEPHSDALSLYLGFVELNLEKTSVLKRDETIVSLICSDDARNVDEGSSNINQICHEIQETHAMIYRFALQKLLLQPEHFPG